MDVKSNEIMFLFAVSIFLSAFLLFQIQPMIGKLILPWFGGTPAVWSTVMLFFQVLLTGGYAYAYWLIERVGTKRQITLHISLITFALLLLILLSILWESPAMPDSSWKPQNVNTPILDIFRLLAASVGLPYFILAANGPLMQAWFSRRFPEHSYARLYALSNLGSLLGLLAYPLLIEPSLPLSLQGWAWAIGFLLFGVIVIRIASQSGQVTDRARPEVEPALRAVKARPPLALRSLWVALSATASTFLLSVTNQITQEVAVVPFLWVLPLALYLLSFILTFSSERGYQRKLFAILFILSVLLTLFVMLNKPAFIFPGRSWRIVFCYFLPVCSVMENCIYCGRLHIP
jgi:MFS family permease